MVYLDYNATTPIDKSVANAMLPYIHGNFGNPSSRANRTESSNTAEF